MEPRKKKPDDKYISEPEKNQVQKKVKSDRDESDVKTQIFLQQTIPEREENDTPKRIKSVDLAIEEKIKHLEKPKKVDDRVIIWILLVAVVLVVALLVFQRERSIIDSVLSKNSFENVTEKGNESEPYISVDTELPRSIKKEKTKTLELSNDIFEGKAPLQVKETGAVISVEKDPELTAIANALLIRVATIYGTKIVKRKEITRELSSGSFQNFKITGIKSRQSDNILGEEISVTTPSGGTFFIKNQVLDSIKKTDFEQIHKDLKDSGIAVSKAVVPGEGLVKVKLFVEKIPDQPEKGDFLIMSQSVGEIMLGMPISEMKALLKGKYRLIKRNILVEDSYYSVYKVEDKNKSPLCFVYEQNGRVWGIQIVDSAFKTQKGVGINSNLGSIRILYSEVRVHMHPRKITYITIDDLKIKFFLQDENINFEQKLFPLETKVSYIIIGKSPYLD